jgi:hypothetical protein
MKYLFIFFLAILLSCESTEDETLVFLNEGVEQCNQLLENFSGDFYSMMEAGSKENPRLVDPIKEKTDSIKLLSESIMSIVELFENEIVSGQDTVGNRRFLFQSNDVSGSRLAENIERYYRYIIQQNEIDSFYSETNIQRLVNEKSELSIAELNRIENKIRLVNYNALSFYFKKIEGKTYRFSKNLPVVIPQKRYLKYGKEYKAKIFMTAIDTTMDMKLILQGDTLFSENGVLHYKEVAQSPDKYVKKGVIEVENPKTYEIMRFPCKIEYLVIK